MITNTPEEKDALIQALFAKVELLRTVAEKTRQALLVLVNDEKLDAEKVLHFAESTGVVLAEELGHAVAQTPTEAAREVVELRRDAGRYRYLRTPRRIDDLECQKFGWIHAVQAGPTSGRVIIEEACDAAIDVALQGKGGRDEKS